MESKSVLKAISFLLLQKRYIRRIFQIAAGTMFPTFWYLDVRRIVQESDEVAVLQDVQGRIKQIAFRLVERQDTKRWEHSPCRNLENSSYVPFL